MEKRNNLFICIFIAILIVLFVYIVPLILINSYITIYTSMYEEGTILPNAYNTLLDSDIEYKDSVILIKKTTDSALQRMLSGYSFLFTYYTICAGLILLVAGICLKKYNANISKVCVITSILLFICGIIYMVI